MGKPIIYLDSTARDVVGMGSDKSRRDQRFD
jgi:hypothetical protein